MLPNWARVDTGLRLLKERMPEWDVESALVKATTINGLYNTNVKWLVPVAVHVSRTMSEAPDDLVEKVASFKRPTGENIKLLSFASKLCHFFIDAEQYPIYDQLALATLAWHGFNTPSRDYGAFEAALLELRKLSGVACSTREFDKYLWIVGAWLTMERMSSKSAMKKSRSVNGELQSKLAMLKAKNDLLLARLVGKS